MHDASHTAFTTLTRSRLVPHRHRSAAPRLASPNTSQAPIHPNTNSRFHGCSSYDSAAIHTRTRYYVVSVGCQVPSKYRQLNSGLRTQHSGLEANMGGMVVAPQVPAVEAGAQVLMAGG